MRAGCPALTCGKWSVRRLQEGCKEGEGGGRLSRADVWQDCGQAARRGVGGRGTRLSVAP